MIHYTRSASSVVHWRVHLTRYQLLIPANKKLVSIEITTRTFIWMWPVKSPNKPSTIKQKVKNQKHMVHIALKDWFIIYLSPF